MSSFFENIASYKYPTLAELELFVDRHPKLYNFGFPNQWSGEAIQDNLINRGIEIYKKKSDLFEWDKLLHNRIIDLNQAYIYVLVHFNRGVYKNVQEYLDDPKWRANQMNVRFYFSYLQYVIATVVDNIYQIINVYFDLKLNMISINALKESKELKVNHKNTHTRILEFANDFKQYSEKRNAVAHRYSPYEVDQRSQITMDDPNKIILGANNDFPNYADEITLVEQSFKTIRDFVSDLKQQMTL